jgi:23S rRNA (pseudouridine1915-N3)-methyltransferase
VNIHLAAVGTRMPGWITEGFDEYARRLPRECSLNLLEIAPGRRTRKADTGRIRKTECRKLLDAIPRGCLCIALDERGASWSTRELAARINGWLADGRDVALLVGGPEGLDDECLKRSELRWSLSPLTLPHPLVRVVVAEQIYRSWSLLQGHPYHRD